MHHEYVACECCEDHARVLEEASGWLEEMLSDKGDVNCLQELCFLLKMKDRVEENLLNKWVEINNQYLNSLNNTQKRAI